jgi:hypothetical protein
MTYYLLKMASWVGIARDLRPFQAQETADELAVLTPTRPRGLPPAITPPMRQGLKPASQRSIYVAASGLPHGLSAALWRR